MDRLVFTSIAFLLIKGCFCACPNGWFQNGERCYYYSANEDISLPFHGAQDKCRSMASDLVIVNDATENNLLFAQLAAGAEVWLGCHDLNHEGIWQWVDGTEMTYNAWGPGQPDNWETNPDAVEDCAVIVQNQGGLWNDISCYNQYYFFCERAENAQESTNCESSDGWMESGGRCYKLVDAKISWTEANSACKAIHSNLVQIGEETEQQFVAKEINAGNQHVWIGLSSVGHTDNKLYWSNGDEFTDSSYNNWLAGPPVLHPDIDTCIKVDPSISYAGPWTADRCGEGHGYMCERGFTGTCADGWELFDGNCYFHAIAQSRWESWISADAICTAMGAQLIKIDNDGLQHYLMALLPAYEDAGAFGVWLGFADTKTDGVFVWGDGVNVQDGYKIFGPNQPRDQVGAYDCGQIFVGSTSGVWETDDCFKRQPYVCQLPTGVDPMPINPPADVNKGCDPGWLGYDNNCYYFERNRQVTWQQAEDECKAYGGHLTSVVTAEENAFITGHASATVWIGGNDHANNNVWVWNDGSPWSFQDWYEGEPNGNAACLRYWKDANFKWDDNACGNLFSYICKKQKIDCWQPLGMEDGRILDSEITSSSSRPGYEATEGRLNNINDATAVGSWAPNLYYADCAAVPIERRLDCGGGGEQPCLSRGCCFDSSVVGVIWCFYKGTVPDPGSEWLQVKLLPQRTVAGVATQGRPSDVNEYVKSYRVSYSTDGNNFQFVKDRSGNTQTFSGNQDTNTPVSNKFYAPVLASYIRIYPYDYNLYPTLRLEVMGCTIDGGDLATSSPNEACTSVTPSERLDCGYGGITPAECVNKGCCWDNSISGVKWCFYAKNQYDPRCGKDWQFDPHGEIFCYHFNDYSLRTWQHARDYCIGMGGDLLSINSQAEQSYVTSQMVTLVNDYALWIGANRNDANSGWRWSDGQPFNYFYWSPGEPNGLGEEYCVEAYTSNAQWNDLNCGYERGIACKKFADVTPPVVIDDNEYVVNICEGETYTVVCPGMQIVIHHASYGRSNIATCSSDQGVPSGGCHSSDSLSIVSQMCNNKELCTLTASNDVFGDPCSGIYKYLNVIYSCEQKTCFGALGVENGTIQDSQISESSFIDDQHRGVDGRLNGPRSWATSEGLGAFMQITFPSNIRVTGVVIQGANDVNRYVTSFTVAFANDDTLQEWTDYTNFDNRLMNFTGNVDQQTPVQVVLAEHVFTSGIRIQPQTWSGDMIGMRMEITGCNPLRELSCTELGDIILAADDGSDDITVVQAECPGLCSVMAGIPLVYGTDIYAGSSQICNAAVHAGVIIDRFGGPVTVVRKTPQSTYKGSVRNGITSLDESYYPVAFSFSGNEKTCQAGWTPYSEFCYYFSDEWLSWSAAEAKCVGMDAHLVSIRSWVEQDFLSQRIILKNASSWWTGFNDLRTYNQFEWVDGGPVLYTNWAPHAPDNYQGKMENCVEIQLETLQWNDYLCDDTAGYICKKYKAYYSIDETVTPTPPAGCPEGWSAYEGMCYLFQRDLRSEEESESFCESLGGVNVHVKNAYVQSFLHTTIGLEDWRWWLGLHAHVSTEDGVSWEWESGDPVTYDNWGIGNPNIDMGECTVFYGGQFGHGMWYSHRCEKDAYSICERPREGWTQPPTTTPPPSGGCAWDWTTPSESSGFCYKVFVPEAEGEFDRKQGWENARHQCLAEGGNLVSIHSKDEQDYLNDQLNSLGVISASVWIGLNSNDGVGWSWSDDSPVEYLNWNLGSPSSIQDNPCVAMKYEPELGTGLWDNLDCHQALDWICQRPKGINIPDPTPPPTGKPNAACGSSDDGIWLEYEKMCYLFNDILPVDQHTAQRTCQTVGGELVSIHTIAESAFITNQIKQMPRVHRFWLGLRETGGVNSQYAWSDGTPVDFVNWSAGEPNDAVGIEQCVTALQDHGMWNDDNCGLEIGGFVCKKYLGAPPNPPQPTDPWPGGCPSNWLMYSNYCYQVHGETGLCDPGVTDNTECAASWRGAVEYCKSVGGALTSIHDKYENGLISAAGGRTGWLADFKSQPGTFRVWQGVHTPYGKKYFVSRKCSPAFITAHTIRAYHNLWIGISDTQWGLYSWANGDEVTYTNWNAGEPNHHNGEENCGELYHTEALAGRWNDKNCDSVTPFVCSMGKDPQIAPGQELNQNKNCPQGWVQYNTVQGNYLCFYLDSTPRTFEAARQNCRNLNNNADLASLQTMFDQHFITSYLRGQTAWIGMKQNPDTLDWLWVDGWPVWVSNWGENQPTSDTSKSCVTNVDSVFGSEWLTASCEESYPSLCKTSTEEIPPTPGTVVGDCRDNSWHEYGGFCVKAFVTLNGQNDARSWSDAEYECTTYGGHLASFTSRHELEWMLDWYNETETLWIGLRNNGQGGWSWIDQRPVSFTYWNEGEPNNAGEDNEDCVEMYGGSGKWNDINCLDEHGYVCLAPKVVGTDDNGNNIYYTTPKPPTVNQQQSNAGMIAGIVIGVLLAVILIGGIAFYFYKNKDTATKVAETASDIPSGIVNKLYSLGGNIPDEKIADEVPAVYFDKENGTVDGDSKA